MKPILLETLAAARIAMLAEGIAVALFLAAVLVWVFIISEPMK